jgi:hypothetical protein
MTNTAATSMAAPAAAGPTTKDMKARVAKDVEGRRTSKGAIAGGGSGDVTAMSPVPFLCAPQSQFTLLLERDTLSPHPQFNPACNGAYVPTIVHAWRVSTDLARIHGVCSGCCEDAVPDRCCRFARCECRLRCTPCDSCRASQRGCILRRRSSWGGASIQHDGWRKSSDAGAAV